MHQGLLTAGVPNAAATAAASAAIFALVAFDVNSPMSLHLLLGPDMAAHTWVAANVPLGAYTYTHVSAQPPSSPPPLQPSLPPIAAASAASAEGALP